MFKSYLKLALRGLWKRKTSTIINILGLSVGLASCALVFLFFQHELSFDKSFDNSSDIYRVTTNFGDGSGAPTVAMPYATYLKSEIPEVEQVSRLDASKCSYCVVQVNAAGTTPYIEENGYWIDPTFFNIFSFHFLQGERQTALAAPNTIVLSQDLAQKLFGNTYAIGKPVKTQGNTYMVSGVFKQDFLNHFNADFFASDNSNGIREINAAYTSWVTNPNFYTYIKLKPGSNIPHVLSELAAYTQTHAAADMKTSGSHVTNGLQALLDIHLHSSQYQSYMEVKQGNLSYLYLLGSIALAILLLGCINYMNLSTAQAIDRAREVGVRRVMGAGKASIRYQFLIETIVISFFALLAAIGLAFLFLPAFNRLTGQTLSFFALENSSLVLWMLLIALLTGIMAGIYPAVYLSSFKPIKVLKGKISDAAGWFSIRKVLVSAQFIISTCLVFASVVIWSQLHFMLNANPGFKQDQQLIFSLNTPQSQKNSAYFIDQLSGNALYQSVTGATGALVSDDMTLYPEGKTVADKHDISLNYADGNYVKTLGLSFISGSNFSPVAFANKDVQQDMEATDIGRQVILNEEAVKVLGFDPYTAIGKYVSHLHNGVVYNYRIVGVVKNYHYWSLHTLIGPFGIMPVNPDRFTTIIAKIKGTNAAPAIQFAAEKWQTMNAETPFVNWFLDDIFNWDYAQDEHEQAMLSSFTFIAIFISSLGLLGLITYSLGQRAKEIGIRKVIGASVANIVLLFYKQYFKLVLIANCIALPLAWYYMNNWLSSFPYRVNISWWIFALALSAGVITAFCTIAFKTIKAAIANPVISLKAE